MTGISFFSFWILLDVIILIVLVSALLESFRRQVNLAVLGCAVLIIVFCAATAYQVENLVILLKK